MKQVWTYFVSRNSLDGVLAEKCDLWGISPLRSKSTHRVTWLGTSVEDPGHIGEYTLDVIRGWFGVIPDSDRELIRAEQWAREDKTKATTKA